MLTKQATFNKVYKFLVAQGRPAFDKATNQCRYRHKLRNGKVLKCAVGCLIPNHMYNPGMENRGCESVFRIFPEVRNKLGLPSHFYVQLQQEHDAWVGHRSLREFKAGMKKIAVCNDLDPSIVK